MGWLTKVFQKKVGLEFSGDGSPGKLPARETKQWAVKGDAGITEGYTLHILDAKRGRPREMQCLIGEHVSREIYERNRDLAGHLYGLVYYRDEKPLMKVVHKDVWLKAQQQIKESGPEVQEISFHCAKDGTEFSVLFAREFQRISSAYDQLNLRT